MSEQPTDPRPPDVIDDETAPKQKWRVRPTEPHGRVPEPTPTEVVEGLRTLYG